MKRKHFVFSALFVFFALQIFSQTTVKKVVLQAFWWDYYHANYSNNWSNYLTELAPRLKSMGVDAIWIPPTSKNESPTYVGYAPFDHYDLGDKFQKNSTGTRMGTKNELLRMIAVMHANGIEVIQDVVLNHAGSAGSGNGSGGQDPNSFSMANNNGYKNFRYVSYSTPASVETQTNYWARKGRWPKNYTNFYPNPSNNCTTGDICTAFFGPDISYESSAFGKSSNVTGFNPTQTSNYMRNEGRNWISWMKKQTGIDGFRWDAVKHFPTYVQEDYSYNIKNTLPTWAKGGQNMFNVGEWVGSKSELDAYVNSVAGPSGDKMMGAFDFNLRAFDPSGGLYGMVYGMGNFDLSTLPGAQQNERVTYYPATNTYVHRTVPFVNNHDTFRPQVSSTGNYIGWNSGSELSAHIDPYEPRLSTAYAVMMSMDGNPQLFFEDLFDIGALGNRYNHDPKSITSLPSRSDIQNLIWCHQALDFKSGAYQVPLSSPDYLIISRSGKVLIGITDNWNTWQNQWVYSGFPAGTVLKDYSGANGTSTSTVDANGWALISTPPVDPSLNIAGRHGYSVWAPVGKDAVTYNPPRATTTTQEWEMANDLGDSHVNSLGQGGALPASSTNFRIVGKIYVESGKPITTILYPENTTKALYVGLYNAAGTLLTSANGTGTLTKLYTPSFTGWITLKVRNNVASNPSQKCWVNVTYTAPAIIANATAAAARTAASIWTGNGESSDWNEPKNWEEGIVPDETSDVVIPGGVYPHPAVSSSTKIASLKIEENAHLFVNDQLFVENEIQNNGSISGLGALENQLGEIAIKSSNEAEFSLYPNPSEHGVMLKVNGSIEDDASFQISLFSIDGKCIATQSGNFSSSNSWLNDFSNSLKQGVYFIRFETSKSRGNLKFLKS